MSRERRNLNNKSTNNTSTRPFPVVYWLINIVLIALVSAAVYFAIDRMNSFRLAMIVSLGLVVLGIVLHIVLSFAQKQYSKNPFKDKQAGLLFTNLLIFICVLLVGSFVSYSMVTNKYLNYDKIYQGVYVDECDLSNLTYDEAKEVVINYDRDKLAAISQSITIDSETTVYTAEDLGIYSDAEAKTQEAFNYGRTSSNFERINEIFELKSNPKVFNIEYQQNADYADLSLIV